MSADFAAEKAALLSFAAVLCTADNPAQLRARLMSATGAPWHSFDPLALAAAVENLGSGLAQLLCADLDDVVGAP